MYFFEIIQFIHKSVFFSVVDRNILEMSKITVGLPLASLIETNSLEVDGVY